MESKEQPRRNNRPPVGYWLRGLEHYVTTHMTRRGTFEALQTLKRLLDD